MRKKTVKVQARNDKGRKQQSLSNQKRNPTKAAMQQQRVVKRTIAQQAQRVSKGDDHRQAGVGQNVVKTSNEYHNRR